MARFFLTTPLYYVNARPHLGHAYSTIVADVMTRFHRQLGEPAVFLTGTDEHGQKIQRAAEQAGLSPQQFADVISARFRREWERLGLDFGYFIRTTEARHTAAVLDVFARLRQATAPDGQPVIYKGSYSGPYCVSDELFVGEGQPGDPCPECGRPTELVTEENYFFRLSAYQPALLDLYRSHPDFIRPETRRNEVIAFVESGLRDVSITRTSIHWGIPVPGDERHVLYVWLDALIGYLSGIGFGSPPTAGEPAWNELWPAWHLVGKEIVRFHCVYWPAFLMAAGLPLPRGIMAHGWLLFDKAKMSKSLGNVVRAEPLRQVVGADALRYFLLREVSFGSDGNFSHEALIGRYNSDLANGWGNLASRTLTMIQKYRGGAVPARPAGSAGSRPAAESTRDEFVRLFQQWQFARALDVVWLLIAQTDKHLAASKPWALAASADAADQVRLDAVLRDAWEVLRFTSVLLASVLPEAAARLAAQLGVSGAPPRLNELTWDGGPADVRIGVIEPLFPRLDKPSTLARIEALEIEMDNEPLLPKPAAPAPAAATAPGTDEGRISIDDFAKVDMRVGEVRTAERIPGSDKLLKLTVDIGTEVRQLVAGIAQAYDPASLISQKVVIVANLQPRKLRGVESNGMIVAAGGDQGSPKLITVPADTPLGSRLR